MGSGETPFGLARRCENDQVVRTIVGFLLDGTDPVCHPQDRFLSRELVPLKIVQGSRAEEEHPRPSWESSLPIQLYPVRNLCRLASY